MWPFSREKRFDEPARLKHFLTAIDKLEWTDEKLVDSLNEIFIALNQLIQSDVEYYDKQRYKHRRLSKITRFFALIFGTIGIIAPLIHNLNLTPEIIPACLTNLTAHAYDFGYLSLAIAAAFLTGNRLFGATGGHIRYVMAQFELGRLLTDFRLQWTEWLAKNNNLPPDKIHRHEAFKLFHTVSDQAYKIIQEETKVWGKTLSDTLEELEYSIGHNLSHKEGKGTESKPENSKDASKKFEGESHDQLDR